MAAEARCIRGNLQESAKRSTYLHSNCSCGLRTRSPYLEKSLCLTSGRGIQDEDSGSAGVPGRVMPDLRLYSASMLRSNDLIVSRGRSHLGLVGFDRSGSAVCHTDQYAVRKSRSSMLLRTNGVAVAVRVLDGPK